MAAFTKEQIINDVVGIEAGYTNNPNDSGGETNHGITRVVANAHKAALVAKFNWDGTMRNLTVAMAFYIYDVDYWNKLKLTDICKISSVLADKLFDIGVNCGTKRAGEWLQRVLNVSNRQGRDYADLKVDGLLGPATIKAINGLVAKRGLGNGIEILIAGLVGLQTSHYISISETSPKNEDFFAGWILNRSVRNLQQYLNAKKIMN